jgi:hypothetical protein
MIVQLGEEHEDRIADEPPKSLATQDLAIKKDPKVDVGA